MKGQMLNKMGINTGTGKKVPGKKRTKAASAKSKMSPPPMPPAGPPMGFSRGGKMKKGGC